jgi:phosphoglycolate phosphatase-like HAD superfamily hydrolase
MPIVLFDFDGVLADTLADVLAFGREACAQLGYVRHPTPADLDALETMSVADYGRQLQLPPQTIDEFSARYLQMFERKLSPPKLFPGMKRVLSEAAKDNTMAIVTGNTTPTVEAFLKGHGLQEYIKLVVGAEQKAPRVEKIRIALRQIGSSDEPVYMVGDAVSDIRAARETSLKSIAVGWGHQSPSRLEAARPDFLAHSPQALLEYLTNGAMRTRP